MKLNKRIIRTAFSGLVFIGLLNYFILDNNVKVSSSKSFKHLSTTSAGKALLTWNDISNIARPSSCKEYFADARREYQIETLKFGIRRGILQICLVTHLSFSRMDKLQSILHRWPGPISAAIYVPRANYSIAVSTTENMFQHRQNALVHIVQESGIHYPINTLRNIAQSRVRCTFIFIVDVDFVPSDNLFHQLQSLAQQNVHNYNNTAWVIPTFEQMEGTSAPHTKKELIESWETKTLMPFHLRPNTKNAHGPTNFTRWKTATSSYKITYIEGFEPYVMIRQCNAPPFIDLFLERYANKVAYFVELNYRGFEFVVVPETFLVHMPHESRDKTDLFKYISVCTGFVFEELKKKTMLQTNVRL